ncbi:SDR family NAD(P)-dependent oxidoreductase [Bacillus cereus]
MSKIIFITGASSGIGYGITKCLLDEGNIVIGTYCSNKQRAMELQKLYSNFEAVHLDFTSPNSVIIKEIDKVIKKYGDLNVLINCAAEVSTISYEDVMEEDFDRIMDINLKKPYFIIQDIYKKKLRGICNLNAVVNISSVSDRFAFQGLSVYEMSKGALSMLTRTLGYEFAKEGVRVNAVAPGAVKVEKNYGDQEWENIISNVVPMGRPGNPNDIAKVVKFLISDDSCYMSGQVIYVDGGLSLRL